MSAIENPRVPVNGLEIFDDGRAADRTPCLVPSSATTTTPAVSWLPTGQAVLEAKVGVTLVAPLAGLRVRLPGWDPSGGFCTLAEAAVGASRVAPTIATVITPTTRAGRRNWKAF